MSMMLGTFEQIENTKSTLLKQWKKPGRHFWTDGNHLVGTFELMKKNLVGTFDEYGADGQGEEGWVSDNKAANISHLSQIFLHCVAVFFPLVKVLVNDNTFTQPIYGILLWLVLWWCDDFIPDTFPTHHHEHYQHHHHITVSPALGSLARVQEVIEKSETLVASTFS